MKKMLRPLSRVFSALMVVSLLTISMAVPMVSAQADGTISIEDVTLQDTPKTIPIRLINMQDWGTLNVTLSWDTSVVDVAISLGADGIAGNINEATATMNFFNALGYDGNAVLAYLTLTPLKPNSSTTITITVNTLTNTVPTALTDYALSNGDVTVLAPSEVWVDDDWASQTDVDDDGYDLVWLYNAFADIPAAVTAIEADDPDDGGTVNVLSSDDTPTYSSFTITEDDVEVIGIEDGASVAGGALVDNADGVTVESLSFTGMVECDTTHDTILMDLTIASMDYGIYIHDGNLSTVTITNCHIANKDRGISVANDTVIVNNTTVEDCNYGVYADTGADVTVNGGTITGCTYGAYALGTAVLVLSGVNVYDNDYGVDSLGTAHVTVEDCCSIHGNIYGFYVDANSVVVANGNNIYDNSSYGVGRVGSYMPDFTENWWGDEAGPIVGSTSSGGRDGIYFDPVFYSPWLDAPCDEGGAPVGASARFAATPRSGVPGAKVQFTDRSVGASSECEIIEWEWNFGDGSTSDEPNPSHVYMREGVFTITLTVRDYCGFSSTTTMKAYITITERKDEDKVEPAKLGVSYLNIDPAQVLPNQEVVISANICNSGEERGSKTVSLMLNGQAIDSQSVAVSGGACQQVVFKTSRAVPGTYQVAVDGMVGQFSVLAPRTVTNNVPSQQSTGLGTAGIIAIIAVLIVLILALIMVFKRD